MADKIVSAAARPEPIKRKSGLLAGLEAWGFAGLILLTAIRFWVAGLAPLAPDEAYYWVWSRALAPGYVDHPPMVALWIRAGTALAGQGALGVRLLGPLAAFLGSLLLFDTARRLFPGRHAGLIAAALMNATLALGVGAVIMTPDTPLIFFWIGALWAGARLAAGGSRTWWLAAGAFAGLALVSKYTAAFLPLGLGLFALLSMPRCLRRPEPWLGAVLAALIFLPVVIWNAGHGWSGFARQGGRLGDWSPSHAIGFLGELIGGQIGMATPGVFVLFAAGLTLAMGRMTRRDPASVLLASLSVPAMLVFLQHALGDRVQANWPAIVFPAAAVAASGLTAPMWRRAMWPSVGLGLAICGFVFLHAATAWPPLPMKPDIVVRRLFGWTNLAADVEAARRTAGAAFVAVDPYDAAAELARALPADVAVVGLGKRWDMTTLPKTEADGGLGILVRPAGYPSPDAAQWKDWIKLAGVARGLNGQEIERYSVFLVHAADGLEMVTLPHP